MSARYWLQMVTSEGQANNPGDEAVYESEADAWAEDAQIAKRRKPYLIKGQTFY